MRFGAVRTGLVVAGAMLVTALAVAGSTPAGASSLPKATVAPAQSVYDDGQTVTVSVGPNSYFTPYSRIVIIECADPGGTTANLPTSFSTCDGNTEQADSVIVQANGSFAESAYTLYALPNVVLGEQSNWQPVCNPGHACVLFIGENQNDFTEPKIFSAPFTFSSTPATLGGGTTTSTTGGSTSTSSGTGAASATASATDGGQAGADSATPTGGTLAFTGPPADLPLLVAVGSILIVLGLVGRMAARRWGQ